MLDTLAITEASNAFTGTDVEYDTSTSNPSSHYAINGTQSGDSVTFTWTQNGTYTATYTGAFVSSVVVDGFVKAGASATDSFEVLWTKQQ